MKPASEPDLSLENAALRERLELAEAALQQSAGLFYTVVDQAPMGVYVVDDEFRLQQINARALPAFAKVDARIGRDFGEVMNILWGDEVGRQLSDIFRHTLRTGEPYVSPPFTEFREDLQEERSYEWETKRVTLPSQHFGVVCYFNDITDKIRSAAALRSSELLYRTIGESIDYGVWVCAPDGRNLYASESFLKLVGLTQERCSNFGWGEVLHPDDAAGTIAAWQECVRTGGNWDREHRFRGVDGQWHHLLARGRPVKDEQGRIISWAGINLDISRLKKTEEALRVSEERIRLALEASDVGIWEWNILTGEIHWDAQMARIYGLPSGASLSYEQWREAVLPEDFPHQEKLLQETIRSRGRGFRQFRIRRAGETGCRYVQAVETVRLNSQGEVEWLIGTNLDITERHQAQTALLEAKAAAESANRSKDHFLAALSHELRTPLMPVLITAETLRDDERLPADVREQLGMIERNIALEARLLDDLFDITAIVQGKLKLRAESCDACALITLAVEIVKDEAAAKNISIETGYATGSCVLMADAARFQQVIWNLLRNAIKFTPPGSAIKIRAATMSGSGSQHVLHLEVIDSGAGIEPGSLEKIFHPFEQAEAAGNHQFGGLGLGLAIARAIVELHGGKIRAKSDGINRGATFEVDFPMSAAPLSAAPPKASPKSPAKILSSANNTLRRLLVVEDHAPTLQVLASLLTRSGYEIVTASSVAAALAAARREKFDLVISDLGLPDGTGVQLMEQLRSEHGLRGVALSGYGMDEDLERTRQAGFVAHLVKPVRIADLRNVLASLS